MKKWSEFNEGAYNDFLKKERDMKRSYDQHEEMRSEEIRAGKKGIYKSKIESDSVESRSKHNRYEERNEIIDRVLQGLLSSERGKNEFKQKLIDLLDSEGISGSERIKPSKDFVKTLPK